MNGRTAWFFSVAVAALAPTQAAAQAPGGEQVPRGSVMAEYKAEVLTQVNSLLADWGADWGLDRPEELSELYWEDALLIPPGGGLKRGRDEILTYFTDTLSQHGSIEAFMLDFDASGGMAQVFGNYMLAVQQGTEAGSQKTGPLITVYLRRGRRWKIRSQVFFPADS